MTRMDDAVSISLFIMTLVTVPYIIKAVPAIRSVFAGNWMLFYEFWMSGWVLVLYGSLLFCIVILFVGMIFE